MTTDRRLHLWSLVVADARGGPVAVDHVGSALISLAGVDASAVAVILAASPRETVYTSGQVAADMEELTLTLGEGPGMDALDGGPELAGDLSDARSQQRWPVFAAAAVDAGVHAAFAFPLRIGGIRLGVMDLYRLRPGGLDHDQLRDALLLADTACALLLDTAHQPRPGIADLSPERASPQHPEVHQATGMIIAQLGVTAAVALIRLRAYAYSHERHLSDVAADVVARRLRFTPETGVDMAGVDHDHV
jgi:hypothetical protein